MKIHETKNYPIFVTDIHNRPITARDSAHMQKLRASMKQYGFLPFPILVRREGAVFKILDGQHRYEVAKELGLQLLYVEVKRDDIVIAIPAAGNTPWSIRDFVGSFAAQGIKAYSELMEFATANKIPVAHAAAILSGRVAGVHKSTTRVKDGSFVVKDRQYAGRIARILSELRQVAPWITCAHPLNAISRFVRLQDFNDAQFVARCRSHPHLLQRRPTLDLTSKMFEEVYNYHSRTAIPLSFQASELGRKRWENGGRTLHAKSA